MSKEKEIDFASTQQEIIDEAKHLEKLKGIALSSCASINNVEKKSKLKNEFKEIAEIKFKIDKICFVISAQRILVEERNVGLESDEEQEYSRFQLNNADEALLHKNWHGLGFEDEDSLKSLMRQRCEICCANIFVKMVRALEKGLVKNNRGIELFLGYCCKENKILPVFFDDEDFLRNVFAYFDICGLRSTKVMKEFGQENIEKCFKALFILSKGNHYSNAIFNILQRKGSEIDAIAIVNNILESLYSTRGGGLNHAIEELFYDIVFCNKFNKVATSETSPLIALKKVENWQGVADLVKSGPFRKFVSENFIQAKKEIKLIQEVIVELPQGSDLSRDLGESLRQNQEIFEKARQEKLLKSKPRESGNPKSKQAMKVVNRKTSPLSPAGSLPSDAWEKKGGYSKLKHKQNIPDSAVKARKELENLEKSLENLLIDDSDRSSSF